MWRLLLQHGQLEEKTVAERAMMHPKEARGLLYTLLKAGALQLQVQSRPRSGPALRGCSKHSASAAWAHALTASPPLGRLGCGDFAQAWEVQVVSSRCTVLRRWGSSL